MPWSVRGFTLIEMLLTVFLIGLTASLVVINVGQDADDIAKLEAKRFAALVSHLQDESTITGFPMAMNQSCYGVNGKSGYGDFYTNFQLKYSLKILKRRVHGAVFDTITKSTFDGIEIQIASFSIIN